MYQANQSNDFSLILGSVDCFLQANNSKENIDQGVFLIFKLMRECLQGGLEKLDHAYEINETRIHKDIEKFNSNPYNISEICSYTRLLKAKSFYNEYREHRKQKDKVFYRIVYQYLEEALFQQGILGDFLLIDLEFLGQNPKEENLESLRKIKAVWVPILLEYCVNLIEENNLPEKG